MKTIMRTAAVAAGGVLATILPAAGVAESATVRYSSMELKTYPFSDPDPVPATDKKIYPYARYNGSSWEASPRAWRTIELENDRIKVVVTPEIGGKVWGAIDKKTGVDFIYFNHVAKFRDIAQCGPWTSGGIEFNFGIVGHAPTCSSPVDSTIRTNADGSVSCLIGATEWICGTTWQVEIRLGAEDDFFETHTTWFNGSGYPEPYYQWMNAAFHLEEKAQFDFPGRYEIFHDGKGAVWPVDAQGRDLSIYANNAFGREKSRHVIDGDNGYYGIWWPSKKVGAFHSNDTSEKYGRKIWLWALSRQGGIWEDLLTDADGQYTELQSGRMFHQPEGATYLTPFKHPTFQPGATDRFVERWGVMREEPRDRKASDFAVARPHEVPADFDWSGTYGLYLHGVQELRNASYTNGAALLKACLAKDPHYAPALDELALLAARRGQWTEARAYARHALSIDTYDAAANYVDGQGAFAAGDLLTARERLGLAAYSPFYRAVAHARAAQVELRRGDWAAALRLAERALEANSLSPDAVRAKVVALRKLGRSVEARACADQLLEAMPFDRGALFETDRTLPTLAKDSRALVRLGSWYEDAGLVDEAARLYSAAGDTLAYVRLAALGKESLDTVKCRPVAGACPSLAGSRPALEAAVKADGHWKFRYYLAVLEASCADDALARSLLEACGAEPDEATFYLFRARFRTGGARLADLRAAERLSDGWRVAYALCEHYDSLGDFEAVRKTAAEALERHPKHNALELMMASALNRLGRNRECVDFLKTVHVLPSEHGRNGTSVWIAANRALAEEALVRGDEAAARAFVRTALSYPENLGTGRPFDLDPVTKDWPEKLRALVK